MSRETEFGRRQLIQGTLITAAIVSVVAAVWSGALPEPFPVLEFALLVIAASLTRRYGLQLPGRGFASFVLGVVLYALLRHGWAFAALVAALGMAAGDLLFRRLRASAALVNAGHLAAGSAVVGFAYERALGGALGAAAFGAGN